tara:strand:+ start:487 stop:873 length:387 start_codon:yes stop_codon:yes gene_type:complete
MKNKRQYRDSAMFTMIGYVGIIIVIFLVLVGVGESTGFNNDVRESIKKDPRPTNHLSNYLPGSFYLELDTISNNLDSLDKRLDSLLKLESVIDSMIEAIDTVWADCTHSIYPDEHVMWITGDGDTIWE